MKYTITTLTIFMLTISMVFGQRPHENKSKSNHNKLIDSLKSEIDQDWIRDNPSFKSTDISFFDKSNEKKYFIGQLKINGNNVPFTWDDNLSLLQFMLNLDSNVNIKKGTEADKYFKGIKISWQNKIDGLIWFNSKSYKLTVDNWHLYDFTECPTTTNFPSLSFEKVIETPYAMTNNIQGLTIFPFNDNFKITSTETTLTTEKGLKIKGFGYDLNNDNIIDIFTFSENIYDDTFYIRLYMNVSGKWECKWIDLDEPCL